VVRIAVAPGWAGLLDGDRPTPVGQPAFIPIYSANGGSARIGLCEDGKGDEGGGDEGDAARSDNASDRKTKRETKRGRESFTSCPQITRVPFSPPFSSQSSYGLSLDGLGLTLARQGRRAEALAAYRRAIELQRDAAAKAPTSVQYRTYLGRHSHHLARLFADLGRPG